MPRHDAFLAIEGSGLSSAPTGDKVADTLDAKLDRLSALADKDVLRRWQAVGVQLLDELPDDFDRLFRACMSRFSDVPQEAREPSLVNWDLLGAKMIGVSPDARRITCEVIVESLAALQEAAAAGAQALPSLTFARIARIAEIVVQEAEGVADGSTADELRVELEASDATELAMLQSAHHELVIMAIAMSLNEWSLARSGVERVQVQFGERSLDVHVGHQQN